MLIKLLILTTLFVSCGREVKISNKLKNASTLSNEDIKNYQKSGILKTGAKNEIDFNGNTFTVSPYSSNGAIQFIKSIPSGSSLPVIFTGGVRGSEVVVETIERK